MANVIGLITVNDKQVIEIDSDPSLGGGLSAPLGSMAMLESGGVGRLYIKVGALDTDWDAVATSANNGILFGEYLRIPIYALSPSGNTLDDVVEQNSKEVSLKIEAQPSRNTAIEYLIPNPGNNVSAASFVLTEGDQSIFGVKTFEDNVVVEGDLTVNGTLTYLNSTNTQITDKLLTLNKGGAAASAGGSGLEFEEDSLITGYLKQSPGRNGYVIKPSDAFELDLNFDNLTADRAQHLANTSGTFVMRSTAATYLAGQVAFFSDANNISSESSLFWDALNDRLGIGTNAPSTNLHVVGGARITGLVGPSVVKADTNGVLSVSAVNLATEVTGVLPITNGGTNSATALNNNRIMISSAGAIVEHSALTQGSVLFADNLGLPGQNNANFFWDNSNSRLGLGTAAPDRRLDVNGTSLFRGSLRYADAGALNANWEVFQSQVSTTNNAVTTIATIAVPTDTALLIEARIIGRRTGGAAGANGDAAVYVRTARFKNVGGTVTINNLQTDYTSEDQAAWNGTLAVSGTNAIVQVQGANNNNVDWAVTYFVQVIG